MREFFFLNSFVIDLTPAFPFLGFKSKETVARGLHLIKKLLRLVQSIDYSIIFFYVTFPRLVPNVLTSSGQSVDNFCVVEGKSDYRNFYGSLISFIAINTKAWEIGEPFFHFILDVLSELTDFRNGIFFLEVFACELLVHVWRDAELTCVVSSRDRFNIPVDEHVVLDTLYILDLSVNKQVEKHSYACNQKTSDFTFDSLLTWNYAGKLEEQVGVAVTL